MIMGWFYQGFLIRKLVDALDKKRQCSGSGSASFLPVPDQRSAALIEINPNASYYCWLFEFIQLTSRKLRQIRPQTARKYDASIKISDIDTGKIISSMWTLYSRIRNHIKLKKKDPDPNRQKWLEHWKRVHQEWTYRCSLDTCSQRDIAGALDTESIAQHHSSRGGPKGKRTVPKHENMKRKSRLIDTDPSGDIYYAMVGTLL